MSSTSPTNSNFLTGVTHLTLPEQTTNASFLTPTSSVVMPILSQLGHTPTHSNSAFSSTSARPLPFSDLSFSLPNRPTPFPPPSSDFLNTPLSNNPLNNLPPTSTLPQTIFKEFLTRQRASSSNLSQNYLSSSSIPTPAIIIPFTSFAPIPSLAVRGSSTTSNSPSIRPGSFNSSASPRPLSTLQQTPQPSSNEVEDLKEEMVRLRKRIETQDQLIEVLLSSNSTGNTPLEEVERKLKDTSTCLMLDINDIFTENLALKAKNRKSKKIIDQLKTEISALQESPWKKRKNEGRSL